MAKLTLAKSNNNKIEYGVHKDTLTAAENEIQIQKFDAILRQMATNHLNDGLTKAQLYDMALNQSQNMTLSESHKAKSLRMIENERYKQKKNGPQNAATPRCEIAEAIDTQQQQQPIQVVIIFDDA